MTISYLLPHLDEVKLSGEVEEDVGVVCIVAGIEYGQVDGDVLHPSQGQIRLPVYPVRTQQRRAKK